jgi:hypothetical protein
MTLCPIVAALLLTSAAAAADHAVPMAFRGEWEAAVVAVDGDYAMWYRPGDLTLVSVNRIGLLRTLDGGGGTIHFLLQTVPDTTDRVTAERPLPTIQATESVEMTARHDGTLDISVSIPGRGTMRLVLGRPMPHANG